jgi:hypothetical protein
MRWTVSGFLFCWINGAKLGGQTVQLNPWFTPPSSSEEEMAITRPHLLALDSDLIVANTTLLAQNDEPLPPSEFNPDPGASQRAEAEAPPPPELFPPILPQLP